ncbi:MAG: ABC transporter permease [Verrucomicrobiales bacterium]|nr:ABC transporter permease [Verrucomicrobiales bacterium]|tara:strand:- start:11130 stop:11879 length:750 start_codon:yes stop_codon:yes gene_type:complete
MGNIKTIAKRELNAYFASPVAYVFIVIFLLLTGFFTFMIGRFLEANEASLNAFFMWHPWLYLFLVPAAGMRLWSEEHRQGTLELLMTMPITPWQAIVGKFAASWLFLGVALCLTFPMYITVNYLGDPDNGVIIGGYIGSFLMAGAYLAVTCLTSALTRNQVIAFIVSVVICLLLILAGWPPVTEFVNGIVDSLAPNATWIVSMVSSFSVMTHFEDFQRGVVDPRHVLFFLSVIGFSLFSTSVVLKSKRS